MDNVEIILLYYLDPIVYIIRFIINIYPNNYILAVNPGIII